MEKMYSKSMMPKFSSTSTPAPKVKMRKKEKLPSFKEARSMAAASLRGTMRPAIQSYKEMGKTVRDIAVRHTPVGVVKSAIGLSKDIRAQRKSEAAYERLDTKLDTKLRTQRAEAAARLHTLKIKPVGIMGPSAARITKEAMDVLYNPVLWRQRSSK